MEFLTALFAGMLFGAGLLLSRIGTRIELPDRFKIDRRLISGSAIFGVGWGLSGIRPGPGLLLLTGETVQSVVFICGVIGGFLELRLLPGAPP